MSKPLRKRNRDPLGKTEHEKRCEQESQTKKYYLEGSQSLKVRTPSQVHRAVEKARRAVNKSHGNFETPQKIYCVSSPSSVIKTPDYFQARRMAIYYQFLNYGAPEENRWEEIKLVNNIMFNLDISPGNREGVLKTLQDCLHSVNNKLEYNPNACYANNGATPIIKDFDSNAIVIYDSIQNGMSYPQVTSILNLVRAKTNLPAIC